MDKLTLAALVERAKARDEQALYDLYQEAFPNVYYLALRMLKSTQDAEDITQETFLAVWKNIGTLMEPEAFFGWVGLIAANKCRDALRKKGIPLAPTEEETVENLQIADLDAALLPQDALDNDETRRLVMKIIDSLPETQRMCVLLYYYQGLAVEQVAGAMECSVGTVKSRLSAARTKIRVGIETFEEKEGVRLHGAAIGLLPFLQSAFQRVAADSGVADSIFQSSIDAALTEGSVAQAAAEGANNAASTAAAGTAGGTSGSAAGGAGTTATAATGLGKLSAGVKVALACGGVAVVGLAVTLGIVFSGGNAEQQQASSTATYSDASYYTVPGISNSSTDIGLEEEHIGFFYDGLEAAYNAFAAGDYEVGYYLAEDFFKAINIDASNHYRPDGSYGDFAYYGGVDEDDLPHGIGFASFEFDGYCYFGDWSHGKRHGTGAWLYMQRDGEGLVDSWIWEGDWAEDLPTGHQKLTATYGNGTLSDGTEFRLIRTFEGEYISGMPADGILHMTQLGADPMGGSLQTHEYDIEFVDGFFVAENIHLGADLDVHGVRCLHDPYCIEVLITNKSDPSIADIPDANTFSMGPDYHYPDDYYYFGREA